MVRGLVIVIMAIDHVRDFTMIGTEQDPMANPNITAALFVTQPRYSAGPSAHQKRAFALKANAST